MIFLRALAILLALTCSALAQSGQMNAGQVWGNPSASKAIGVPASVSAMIDRAIGSTRGAILERGATGWGIVAPGTSGLPWVSAGPAADPSYAVLGVSGGGTNCSVASGTCLDNITGFNSTTGYLTRTGAGAYSFSTSLVISTAAIGGCTIGGNAFCVTGLSALGALTITSTSANSLTVGPNGTTNPAFLVDGSQTSEATGIRIIGFAAGGASGVRIDEISSATNDLLQINSKGNGILYLNNLATGQVQVGNPTGGIILEGQTNLSSTSGSALCIATNATCTNPAFKVDASIASQADGLNIVGGSAGGGAALSAISSGGNSPLSVNGKGSGVVAIGNVSTGQVQIGGGGGAAVFTGTAAPASASGNTVVLGTLASAPSLTNNGQAFFYNESGAGAIIQGAGSSADFTLLGKGGSTAFTVPTGTTTLNFPALSGGTCVNGLAIQSGGNMITVACPGAAGSIQVGATTITSGTANNILTTGGAGNLLSQISVVPAANGGAGTITGALKGNGSGTVSQAATSDLSDVVVPTSWTPSDQSGASLTFTSVTALYTRIGKHVVAQFRLTFPSTASSAGAAIGGLPVASSSSGATFNAGSCTSNVTGGFLDAATMVANTSVLNFNSNGASPVLNSQFSTFTLTCTISYISN